MGRNNIVEMLHKHEIDCLEKSKDTFFHAAARRRYEIRASLLFSVREIIERGATSATFTGKGLRDWIEFYGISEPEVLYLGIHDVDFIRCILEAHEFPVIYYPDHRSD